MEALIAALERDPERVRRRRGLVIGAGLLIALSSVALLHRTGSSPLLCRGGPTRLAQVWESPAGPDARGPRRDAVKAALLASGVPSPGEVGERVAAALDLYATRWLSSYGEACRDTLVRHAQTATVMDLRMTCLEERRRALVALVDILAKADRDVASNAVSAANALPPIERCSDLASLDAPVEPPRDEGTRQHVERIRAGAAVAKALNDTGRHREAEAAARRLVDEARTVGYQPLLAELLALLSGAHTTADASVNLGAISEEALWTAFASGRDDLAAEMATALVFNIGAAAARPDAGAHWAKLAHALLDRLGAGHDLLHAWLAQNEGLVLAQRDPKTSLALYRTAAAIKQRVLPSDHPDIALTQNSIAEELHQLGRDDEALAVNASAHATFVRAYGPASLDAALTLSNRGEYLLGVGRAREAVPALREAAQRWAAHVGPEHANLGYPLTALGRALEVTGHPDEAVVVLSRALHLREAGEPNAALVAETRAALAHARSARHAAP
jgi:hypothetical protein